MKAIGFWVFMAGFLFNSISFAAGFDCKKAFTPTEKTICSDSRLSELDDLLVQAYGKALSNAADPDAVKAEQRSWLEAKRNGCRDDKACLMRVYNDRLARLNSTHALSNSAHRQNKNSRPGKTGIKPKAVFDEIQLVVEKDRQEEGYYSVQLKRANKIIYEGPSSSIMGEPEAEILNDSPQRGCKTMTVDLHSGGNHCCASVLLCTHCDGKNTVHILDLGEGASGGFKDVDGNGVSELKIFDCAFNNYGVDVPGHGYWGISHASSRCMERLMVFDGGQWRLDRPGEFKESYLRLGQEARDEARKSMSGAKRAGGQDEKAVLEEEAVAGLMQATYYSLMAMNPEKESLEVFRKTVPGFLQSSCNRLFADIKKAVAEFKPLERVE